MSLAVYTVPDRLRQSRVSESFQPQTAGVAVAARDAVVVRVVTARRERIVDPQTDAERDDLRFRELDKRRADADLASLDPGARREIGHALERRDVLGTAIRIPGRSEERRVGRE